MGDGRTVLSPEKGRHLARADDVVASATARLDGNRIIDPVVCWSSAAAAGSLFYAVSAGNATQVLQHEAAVEQ
jgi:hypothetical protein